MVPRTVAELQTLLESRQLYPWHAAANGTEPYEGYALLREGPKWIVFYNNRGAVVQLEQFVSEQEAVEGMITRLRKDVFASYLDGI